MDPRIEYFEPKFETMSKDDLLDFQWTKFKAEIRRVWGKNRFYRKKFSQAGIHPADIRTREDITKIPVTTKEELIKDALEYPPYGSRLQVPTEQLVMVVETSGTSGKGQEVHPFSKKDTIQIFRAEAFGFFWAGVRRGTVLTLTYPVSMTSAPVWWNGTATLLGANILNTGTYDAREKLKYMQRFKAEVLQVSSAYLKRLEYTAEEMHIDVRALGIKSMFMSGGGLSTKWIRRTEEKWGAKLYEQYGCTGRAITWTCEYGMLHEGKRGLIHWLPHLCMIEVVDRSSGRHVSPGEEGEIVITPLESHASPLIRFVTNDKGKFLKSDQCPCGRPFDGFECASIGRYDDMIKVKGINMWQGGVDKIIFGHPEIVEYRGEVVIAQAGREEAVVSLEFPTSTPMDTKGLIISQVSDELRKNIGIGFKVLEWRGPSFFDQSQNTALTKIRRWKDRRGEV